MNAGHERSAVATPPDHAPNGPGWPRSLVGLATAAILLRLLLFLGRGHYVAFDEGWYLLLGRNLWAGDGYTLSGLQHVALSPLFPVLAGALDAVTGDAVWAGRLVAAVASGLVVVPCWFVFHRLAGRTTTVIACSFVALMPSLAPFVAPYWIGWDLWVGAEPLLHLFLFTGLAFFLRAWERGSKGAAVGCGLAFGLAYLARAEAIVAFALLGLVAAFAARRSLRARALPAALCAAAFALAATPYWSYLHDSLGRWAITGRGIQVVPSPRNGAAASGTAANRIEAMLWWDESTYVRALYSLNAAGTALANGYWGVRPAGAERADEDGALPDTGAAVSGRMEGSSGQARPATPDSARPAPSATPAAAPPGGQAEAQPSGAAAPPEGPAPDGGLLGSLGRYVRAMGIAVPWYAWLFVAIGVAAPALVTRRGAPGAGRGPAASSGATPTAPGGTSSSPASAAPDEARRPDLEALVAAPIIGTSVLIAVLVATDPRTQLFVAPLACFYAARGTLVAARALEAKMGTEVRTIFATGLVAGALALVLFATHARRLYLSLAVGSPHHIVAAENAVVGAALRGATPPHATVMSWHPAIALFADRDWRVLPLEPMNRIVGYARTQPTPYLVFSVYYPPELLQAEEPHYLVVHVAAETPSSVRWRIEVQEGGATYAFGRLIADS